MKTLTICQPFAELIAGGEKLVENRTWRVNYRGPLLIHAGLSRDWFDDWPAFSRARCEELPRGVIVARAELVDCLRVQDLQRGLFTRYPAHANSPHAHGPWCWLLESIERLKTPIPAQGKPGLWEFSV